MKNYINYFLAPIFLFTAILNAQVVDGEINDPGDIAFVGYHDTNDGFSFVFLDDCPAGTTIRFLDEEWDGTNFISASGEGEVLWENNTGSLIAAGTVVNILNADDNGSGISASSGTAAEVEGGFGTSASLVTEQIYAVTGTRTTPGVFLTFIGSTSNASLANTGLTLGANAVQVTGEGYYSGGTSCSSTITDCASMLNTPGNWTVGEFNFPDVVPSVINLGGVLSINKKELQDVSFANPVNETLEIYSKNAIDKIGIYNISGSLVVSSSNNKVDVGHLKSGIYLAKIITANNMITKKLVIN